MTDPYKVLGVSPNASDAEIKKAYRELSRQYHPDAYANNPLADLAEEKFKEVQEAYRQIMDMREGRGNPYANGGYYNNNSYNNTYNNTGNNTDYNNTNRQQYDQNGQYYGRSGSGNYSCCDCCCDLWCADTLCECMGGDLCSCI